jgi:tRNA-Thr(GGU) m(6)t(6)A37 methyltransferase TsaA
MKAQKNKSLELRPIGVIRSKIKERSKAPKQGPEGAPDVWLEVHPFAMLALDGLAVGDELIVLTWLHRAHRDTLKVRPRPDPSRRLTGVFATRSPDRPNPIGLHQVTVRKISKKRLRVGLPRDKSRRVHTPDRAPRKTPLAVACRVHREPPFPPLTTRDVADR